MIDDHDVVGEFFGLFKIVGGEQHGHTAIAKIGDDAADELAAGGVDAGSGFIEKRDIGTTNQSQREREALLLATRHRAPGRGSVIS